MKYARIMFLMLVFFVSGCKKKIGDKERMCSRIDIQKLLSLFPQNSEDIERFSVIAQKSMNTMIHNMSLVEEGTRNFKNTVRVYDSAKFQFYRYKDIIEVYARLADNPVLRNTAQEMLSSLDEYERHDTKRNVILHSALQEYDACGSDIYVKRGANKQFLRKKIQYYKHIGMHLDDHTQSIITHLEDEIQSLLEALYKQEDKKASIALSSKELQGVSLDDISHYAIGAPDVYELLLDQKTYHLLMNKLLSSDVRKRVYDRYNQEMYTTMIDSIEELLEKRTHKAITMGFDNYADYVLSMHMVESAEQAEKFLREYISNIMPLYKSSIDQESSHVKMVAPWDESFLYTMSKKRQKVVSKDCLESEFDMLHVVAVLLQDMSHFCGIEYSKEDIESTAVWGNNVLCYKIYSLHTQLVIGYIFFDLTNKSFKISQEATALTVLPAVKDDCSTACVGSSVVVANYNKNQEGILVGNWNDVISLLKAMTLSFQMILGAAPFVDYSGVLGNADFVKIPQYTFSYMLHNYDTVKQLYAHTLSQECFNSVCDQERIDMIYMMMKQAFLSLAVLKIYQQFPEERDIFTIYKNVCASVFNWTGYVPDEYDMASLFSALIEGPKLYNEVWSRVIAADFYTHIQKNGGFSNVDIGRKFTKDILQNGGFISSKYMIKSFLNRPFTLQSSKALLEQS